VNRLAIFARFPSSSLLRVANSSWRNSSSFKLGANTFIAAKKAKRKLKAKQLTL
jgi:hypothetical protein